MSALLVCLPRPNAFLMGKWVKRNLRGCWKKFVESLSRNFKEFYRNVRENWRNVEINYLKIVGEKSLKMFTKNFRRKLKGNFKISESKFMESRRQWKEFWNIFNRPIKDTEEKLEIHRSVSEKNQRQDSKKF